MRMRTRFLSLAAVVAVALTMAASTDLQRPDLASSIFPANTIEPKLRLGSALTGSMVDVANYGSAMALIHQGHVVESAGAAKYAVLYDSVAGSAAALVDSVLMDTVDIKTFKVAYRGSSRWLRILIRAGVAGTDTAFVAASILRGSARFRN